ncbi:MAG: hypothetical protein LBH65_05930, partial [Desulfovibrio sp.]|nr:hypothetical protein [Desulfovibrio sp.]
MAKIKKGGTYDKPAAGKRTAKTPKGSNDAGTPGAASAQSPAAVAEPELVDDDEDAALEDEERELDG